MYGARTPRHQHSNFLMEFLDSRQEAGHARLFLEIIVCGVFLSQALRFPEKAMSNTTGTESLYLHLSHLVRVNHVWWPEKTLYIVKLSNYTSEKLNI